MGISLLGRPVRKQYATLSVWTDETALTAFSAGIPHVRLMADLSKEMGPAKLIRWTMKGSEG